MKTYMIEAALYDGRGRWFSGEIMEGCVQEEIEKYESMIDYFGGGVIQTWELVDEESR